ncbi:putative toxin-antitoxin system toxin component, PIN family [Chroogloeocystis siderophila]|jgi:putative PIN family toxin of toxin-antitoxin system|uniref:Putative toxin-antitoxin system toxin component, PIN family n=1 Tax=Chroogloeocystis siderophila 5.2 s.c.1 TaxID=247279 RepID=A0A1U7HN69_9CHRO|nr:putative toxin-antitoxin system toxin component, PIN family [Chroogloeocystis siderophila]OKH25042.1 putative toxin-antitoxin system toxin component, PIN family [Chroogloeocystis siderophila 5.2 s.c.1]
MRLVVDANILVAELIRKRGRELIVHPALELYMAQMAWEETCHELSKRVEKMVQKQVFSQEVGQKLLTDAIALAETKVLVVPHEVYASYEVIAKLRIPRDPNDWFTVALALVLQAGIWTNDSDFLGCGLPTWTTETLISHLAL